MTRLECQVTRYKSASEEAEKAEEELKVEKRRLLKEVNWLTCISRCSQFSQSLVVIVDDNS